MHQFLWAISFSFLIGLATQARGQEWTRFRGPDGQGVVEQTTLPSKITPADINWKTPLPGKGHSSPVLWGDKIFLQSGDPDTALRHLICVSATSGEVLWQRDFPSGKSTLHGRNSYGTSTPAVDNERVYFTWASPQALMLVALNHEGQDAWLRDLGPHKSEHGYGVSPIVYEDKIILPNFQLGEKLKRGEAAGVSSVIALDRKTGKDMWETPRKSLAVTYSAPLPVTLPDGSTEIVISSNSSGVFALDPATGKENWSLNLFKLRPVSSPFLAKNMIFCTAGEGANGHLVALKPGSPATVVYETKAKAPYVPSPIAWKDYLFMWNDVGIISCLELTSGQLKWTERLGGNFSSSPVRAGDQIYNLNDEGKLVCIRASAEKLEVLGEYDFAEECRATSALAGGKLYVRTVSHLYSIGK